MTDDQFKVFIKEVRAIRRSVEAIPQIPAATPYSDALRALSGSQPNHETRERR